MPDAANMKRLSSARPEPVSDDGYEMPVGRETKATPAGLSIVTSGGYVHAHTHSQTKHPRLRPRKGDVSTCPWIATKCFLGVGRRVGHPHSPPFFLALGAHVDALSFAHARTDALFVASSLSRTFCTPTLLSASVPVCLCACVPLPLLLPLSCPPVCKPVSPAPPHASSAYTSLTCAHSHQRCCCQNPPRARHVALACCDATGTLFPWKRTAFMLTWTGAPRSTTASMCLAGLVAWPPKSLAGLVPARNCEGQPPTRR